MSKADRKIILCSFIRFLSAYNVYCYFTLVDERKMFCCARFRGGQKRGVKKRRKTSGIRYFICYSKNWMTFLTKDSQNK
jgi:hypothetical protein